MRLFLILLLLFSGYSRAGETQIFDVVINIDDDWISGETPSGAEILISKSEILSLNIIQAPEALTKDQIHGKSNPKDFSNWGEFYGSTSKDVDSIDGKVTYDWLLYNGNYILLVQYVSNNPKSLNSVEKYLRTLKRVAP